MPDQRKESKVHIGAYIEGELKERLIRLAKERGYEDLSPLIVEILQAAVAQYQRKLTIYPPNREDFGMAAEDAKAAPPPPPKKPKKRRPPGTHTE
jgi:hypothetical protein